MPSRHSGDQAHKGKENCRAIFIKLTAGVGKETEVGHSYVGTFEFDAFTYEFGADAPADCEWWDGELGPGEMIFIPEEWSVPTDRTPSPLQRKNVVQVHFYV